MLPFIILFSVSLSSIYWNGANKIDFSRHFQNKQVQFLFVLFRSSVQIQAKMCPVVSSFPVRFRLPSLQLSPNCIQYTKESIDFAKISHKQLNTEALWQGHFLWATKNKINKVYPLTQFNSGKHKAYSPKMLLFEFCFCTFFLFFLPTFEALLLS